jgi:lantibiotic leader peptide-processing serine protease
MRRYRSLGRLIRMMSVLTVTAGLSAVVGLGATQSTYLILYKNAAVGSDAATVIANAGGELVAAYGAIGVAVARSGNPDFRNSLLRDGRVENVASTEKFSVQLSVESASAPPLNPGSPVADTDPFSPYQWDMAQIHAPEAHAITGGSPAVLVGVIDTGLDFTHSDLAPNYDASRSTNCLSGAPAPLLTGNDVDGHGTHVAGTIAAAANGVGIVGVAPNSRIAGIKAGDSNGFFFPEAVLCSFMWAGTHDFDVVNNSYFVDPWLFNCRNDAEQRAIWQALQRAIRFAMQNGVTVVAAAGNENMDLSKKNTDMISPDFPPGAAVTREVTNACVVIPAEIPGVITVAANGANLQKSYYSNYGLGVVQVIAPGGDARFQRVPVSDGFVLSTIPGDQWGFKQGTSMASPHVAGVAALVTSRFGKMSPGALQAWITRTADPLPCPDPYAAAVQFPAICQGGVPNNGFNGKGQVNALRAIVGR